MCQSHLHTASEIFVIKKNLDQDTQKNTHTQKKMHANISDIYRKDLNGVITQVLSNIVALGLGFGLVFVISNNKYFTRIAINTSHV